MAERVFLGKYQVIRVLGEGGMGQVYLAQQLDMDRKVVIKVLHRNHANDPRHREAFKQEIDFLNRFRHPSSVELYEASMTDPEGPCAVMEYIDGVPLDELLERHGRFAPERVGRLLGQLCAVLHVAHGQGIIHRDLKSGNIMVLHADTPEERIKVLDFGLARLAQASTGGLYIPMEKITGATAHPAVGTPEYSCPEQFRGQDVDQRGDIYSIGIILYELLSGKRPFDRPSVKEVVAAQMYDPPPRFAQVAGAVRIPPAIEEVVLACLAKDPNQRPQSARELALGFERALGEKIWVDEEGAPQPASNPPLPSTPDQGVEDPHVLVGLLEAWMPEAIAVVKLRGFLSDMNAQVIESLPGLLRVQLKRPIPAQPETTPPPSGFLSRLGFGKKPAPVPEFDQIDMEVHMMKQDPANPGKLSIEVRLRPAGGGPLPEDPAWHEWCEKVHAELSGYLMAK